jgi:hypothetical protein
MGLPCVLGTVPIPFSPPYLGRQIQRDSVRSTNGQRVDEPLQLTHAHESSPTEFHGFKFSLASEFEERGFANTETRACFGDRQKLTTLMVGN